MPGTRGEGPGGRGVGSAPCWAAGLAVRHAAAPRALDTITGPPANGELAVAEAVSSQQHTYVFMYLCIYYSKQVARVPVSMCK